MHTKPPKATAAFTLLELSIIMTIVALIAAAIVTGRTMIDSSATQSVIAEFDIYRNAVLSYRDKYKEFPGDHSSATSLTSADAGCPLPATSDDPTSATCNGNGDGIIGDSTGNPLGGFTEFQESLLVWQHLANDNLLKGKFNGRRSTATNGITTEINAPLSQITDASFTLRYFPTNDPTHAAKHYAGTYGHVFFFGAPGGSAPFPFNGAALTTEQAKSIDQKIDDGSPGLGKVVTSPKSVRDCPTTDVEETAIYDSSITTLACSLIFITGF